MVSGIVEGLNSAQKKRKLLSLPNPSTHNNYLKIIIKRKHCGNIVYYCLPICFFVVVFLTCVKCTFDTVFPLWKSQDDVSNLVPERWNQRRTKCRSPGTVVNHPNLTSRSHTTTIFIKGSRGKKRPKSKRKWGTKRSRETFWETRRRPCYVATAWWKAKNFRPELYRVWKAILSLRYNGTPHFGVQWLVPGQPGLQRAYQMPWNRAWADK